MNVKYFEDLTVWKEARQLVLLIYKHFSSNRDWGFRDQIQRAAISTMNNIAEGFERNSDQDFARFLKYAKASCGETRSMLYLAHDLNYMAPEQARETQALAQTISARLGKLIKYLQQSSNQTRN